MEMLAPSTLSVVPTGRVRPNPMPMLPGFPQTQPPGLARPIPQDAPAGTATGHGTGSTEVR
jgi:hypothetical protein